MDRLVQSSTSRYQPMQQMTMCKFNYYHLQKFQWTYPTKSASNKWLAMKTYAKQQNSKGEKTVADTRLEFNKIMWKHSVEFEAAIWLMWRQY